MTPNNNSIKKTVSFTAVILKGIGQIMLQENQITGFLFLIGIFYGSFTMGLAAVLATICGTATAYVLKYDKSEIDKGLYGFSAALVGVAIMLFFKPVILSWLLIILGSSLATVIQQFFIKRKIPVFTLPFVLVTWAILLFVRTYFTEIIHVSPTINVATIDYFTIGFRGFGQVIFQDNLVSGFLFFIAVFISSPISALYGFAGAMLSAIIAFNLSVPIQDISIGLFSFNAVLCAIVFAGNQTKDGILVLVSVFLSLFISILMVKFSFIQLTFPFVLASCVMLFFKKLFVTQKQTGHS